MERLGGNVDTVRADTLYPVVGHLRRSIRLPAHCASCSGWLMMSTSVGPSWSDRGFQGRDQIVRVLDRPGFDAKGARDGGVIGAGEIDREIALVEGGLLPGLYPAENRIRENDKRDWQAQAHRVSSSPQVNPKLPSPISATTFGQARRSAHPWRRTWNSPSAPWARFENRCRPVVLSS